MMQSVESSKEIYIGNLEACHILTREGEVQLAREIEDGQLELLVILIASGMSEKNLVKNDPAFLETVDEARRLYRKKGDLSLKWQNTQRIILSLKDCKTDLQLLVPAMISSNAVMKMKPKKRVQIQNRILAVGRKIERAGSLFIQSNLRLVVTIAKKSKYSMLHINDLVQEGNIGLIKAVSKFDYRKGYKFSTYATWWVRQAINRAIADKGRSIRVPVHMLETKKQVELARRAIILETGREPSAKEVAEQTEVSVKKAKAALVLCAEPISLELPIRGKDSDARLGDLIKDESVVSPVHAAIEKQVVIKMRKLLGTLPAREEAMMRMRFGIGYEGEDTLENIGRYFGVTRERVRQIEAKALGEMRRTLDRENSNGYSEH
jgi:RNA polymerase sigma factor (sigma-70 family)